MSFKQVFSIVKYTLIESFRDRFLIFLILLFPVAIAVSYYISQMSAVNQDTTVKISISALLYYLISLISLIFVPISVNREVNNNFMLIIRAKPLSSYAYILGKTLAYAVIVFFAVFLSFITLAIVFKGNLKGIILYSYGMFLENIITLSAGVLFGIYFRSLATAILFTMMFFFISHSTYEFVKMAVILDKPVFILVSKAIYYLFPSYDYYDFSQTLIYREKPFVKIHFLTGYTLFYVTILFMLSSYITGRRNIS